MGPIRNFSMRKKKPEQYPDDKRPRNAIEAARKVIENDTEENRNAAAYVAATRKEMKVRILTYAISLIAPTVDQGKELLEGDRQ